MRPIFFIMFVCIIFPISACAPVLDKGRYDQIVKSDNKFCSERKDVVFHIKEMKRRAWYGEAGENSYFRENLANDLTKKLKNSNCFNNVEHSRIQLITPPKDALYLEVNTSISDNGFIPLFTPVLSLVFPMKVGKELSLEMTAYEAGTEKILRINDYYNAYHWSLFIILAPFADQDPNYQRIKENEMIDAMLLQMKNEGILKIKKI